MLPPHDSMSHQQHKANEFLVNGRTIRAPPPTYTAATTPAMALRDMPPVTDEEDDDVYSAPPITIEVDTAIRVDGQGNNVSVPAHQNVMGLIHNTLKLAGATGDTEEERRPIKIKVNATTIIKGNSNTVYRSMQLVRKPGTEEPAPCSPKGPSQTEERKRRAESVSTSYNL